MRENWATEPESIRNELTLLQRERTPLALMQDSQNPQLTTIKAIQQIKTMEILVVHPAIEMGNLINECLFFYRPPGEALRGFRCQPIRKINQLLGLKFPTKIFRVERRQQPRLPTPPSAMAIFPLANRNRPIKCTIGNLSREGARLISQIPGHLRLTSTIAPLTLSLVGAPKQALETRIQICEASLVWSKAISDTGQEQEFGISFLPIGNDREHLENYLAVRTLEEIKIRNLVFPSPATSDGQAINPCK